MTLALDGVITVFLQLITLQSAACIVYFINSIHVGFIMFQQLGLERELIKVQGNLEAEMNVRNQANSAKTDMECKH